MGQNGPVQDGAKWTEGPLCPMVYLAKTKTAKRPSERCGFTAVFSGSPYNVVLDPKKAITR